MEFLKWLEHDPVRSFLRPGGRRQGPHSITSEVENLADAVLLNGALPPAARSDAIHVAAATLAEFDFLLTWNCRHLANAHLQKQLRAFMATRGLTLPEVCTPIVLGRE